MLKNRDIVSNPYRVPPQPTSMWVKVSISLLTLLLLATMGGLLYIMLYRMQCGCEGRIPTNEEKSTNKVEVLSSDEAANRENAMATLFNRLSDVDVEITMLRNSVGQMESQCRRCRSFGSPVEDIASTTANNQFRNEIEDKVARIDSYARVCINGHWRHGVNCYAIVEAAFDQENAKNWCSTTKRQATLAIIKDKLTQNFIVSKLTVRTNSYWIGIERKSGSSANAMQRVVNPISPSSVRNKDQYFYVDGTRVHRNIFHMWISQTSSREETNCASMTFDNSTGQWRWKETACSEGLGYICQYYILP